MGALKEALLGDRGGDRAKTGDHPGLTAVLSKLDRVSEEAHPSNADLLRSFKARCPSHDDQNPSLSVLVWQDGSVAVKCWAGCDSKDVLSAIDVDPRVLRPAKKAAGRKSKLGDPVTTYAYHDEQGVLLYRVARYEPKDFRMERPDGKSGWISNLRGVRRVLFRLPRVIEAVATGSTLFVVEGEKDVRQLEGLGLYATCNPGGAGNWKDDYTSHFFGARAVIIPDNDEAGMKHARAVARAIIPIAKSVKLLRLEGVPAKGDVSDWLAAGHTVKELLELSTEAPSADSLPAEKADEPDDADRKGYSETESGLFKHVKERSFRIANFTARITKELIEDDGAEATVTFEITAKWRGKTRIFTLSAEQFFEMDWHVSKVDARAAIMPRVDRGDVRYAIQLHSDYETVVVYTHTGWRRLETGDWVFLHAGGAIGAKGTVPNIQVRLDRALEAFELPDPPAPEDASRSLAACLQLLGVAPHRIAAPLFGAAWRAPLGAADFGIQVTGSTGVGKTELASRAQQHFGARFHSRSLPASWSSTANALEGLLFHTKDLLVVIDDFAPRGNANSVRQMQSQADRLFRNQGNAAWRGRMRADTSLRPPKPPRGLVVSTGEDVGTGRSATARSLVVEVNNGDVKWAEMSVAQANGVDGAFARGMSGFIQYLAKHYDEIEASRREAVTELRARAEAAGQHPRTPDIIANLLLGWRWVLRYALEVRALTAEEAVKQEATVLTALLEVAEVQHAAQGEDDPVRLFLAFLSAALDSRAAHLCDTLAECPTNWERLGWEQVPHGDGYTHRPLGKRVGFIDGADVYLIPEVALQVVQEATRNSAHSISVTQRALHKALYERGLLKTMESRGGKRYFTTRIEIAGKRVPLLHLDASALGIIEGFEKPM